MVYRFMRIIADLPFNIAASHSFLRSGKTFPETAPWYWFPIIFRRWIPLWWGWLPNGTSILWRKKELFRGKFLNWFMHKMNCIPIDRDKLDRSALRESITVLREGGILGVFPEGTRGNGKRIVTIQKRCLFYCFPGSLSHCSGRVRYGGNLFNPFAKPAEVHIGASFSL